MDIIDRTGQWVAIVYVDGDDYKEAESDDAAMATYFAQWDMGSETDEAHALHVAHDPTSGGAQWGTHDAVSVHRIGGLDYVFAVNRSFGYASLSRRPLA